MAGVLIMMLLGWFTGRVVFYQIAVPLLVINMIVPYFFYPFAVVWYGLAGLLGDVVSRVVLTLVYLLVVIPAGFIRKLAGKDPLLLKQFGKSGDSVMVIRDHEYNACDLEKPF
jgi:hypothetical protein